MQCKTNLAKKVASFRSNKSLLINPNLDTSVKCLYTTFNNDKFGLSHVLTMYIQQLKSKYINAFPYRKYIYVHF